MDRQPGLFPEIDDPPEEAGPPGFRYREDVITEQEETALASSLAELDLKPFEFQGHVANRRVVSFGLAYDYARHTIDTASEMPAFLDDLLDRAAEFAGCDKAAFRQVGVNEYRSGAGVGWHRDKPQFGIIVGVSLLAAATMRFRKADGAGWIRVSRTLKPRSIYILSGEARTQWEHSVPPVEHLRYSINFRTLSEKTSV